MHFDFLLLILFFLALSGRSIHESLSSLADLFFTLSSRDKFLEKFIIQNATQLKNNKALLSIYIALILNAMDVGDNAEALNILLLRKL